MRSYRFIQVDVFTNRPFGGNPLAVFPEAEGLDDEEMQMIAREMNLSETAFLMRQEDGFDLRWFTQACEVALCGHATLASAHALWLTGALKSNEAARFITKSGLLLATQKDNWIELDFPLDSVKPVAASAGLKDALGISWNYVGHCSFGYFLEYQ